MKIVSENQNVVALRDSRRPSHASDATVNEHVQLHAMESDWEHARIVEELVVWFGRFNSEFFGGALPPAAISIEQARPEVLGSYRYGRDGLALRHRINLNSIHVAECPADRLETLLHEMVHQWEEVVHEKKNGTRYHTVAFRRKAAEFGIPTHEEGFSMGVPRDGRFARLIREHGIALDGSRAISVEPTDGVLPSPAAPVRSVRPTKSRLAKWRCGCTSVWASSGVEVDGLCRRCGKPWERALVVKGRRSGAR